jgi:hypothetical protein
MKKYISILLVVLCTASYSQKMQFGVKAGANMSNGPFEAVYKNGTTAYATKNFFGFHLGGFANIKMTDAFSFQPEILYTKRGSKAQFQDEIVYYRSTTYTTDVYSSFIEVPLNINYKVVNKLYVSAGPQVSFLLKANEKSSSLALFYNNPVQTESIYREEQSDVTKQLETINFGLNFGAQYDITKNIIVSAKYVLGLSNQCKPQSKMDYSNNTVYEARNNYKTNSLMVSFGYKI